MVCQTEHVFTELEATPLSGQGKSFIANKNMILVK